MKCFKSLMIILLILVLNFQVNAFSYVSDASVLNANLVDSAKSKISFTFGMDLVTRYIWRGAEFGVSSNGNSSPHFQPNAALTFSLGNASSLSLGFWGSYCFDGSYSEDDLYLNYSLATSAGNISLTLNDYYYPYLGIPINNFDGDGLGAHTIDAQISYTLPEKFPLSLLFSTNIHNDLPGYKSIYLELGYPFTINDVQLNLFAGFAQGQSIWHSITSDSFEFCNVGFKASKSIKITQDYSLPVGIYWIYNHHQKKTFLVFKISL